MQILYAELNRNFHKISKAFLIVSSHVSAIQESFVSIYSVTNYRKFYLANV